MIAVNSRVADRARPLGFGQAAPPQLARFWNVRMDAECAPVLAATVGFGDENDHREALLSALREQYAGDWLFEVTKTS